MAPNSYLRNKLGDPLIGYHLDGCLKVLGSFGTAERSSDGEQVEVLLVLEQARLYTWAIALGIVNTTEEPSVVVELTSFYRQQSVTEVLRTLFNLLTDDDLITKACGCLPRGSNRKTPVQTLNAPTMKTAGSRLAAVFENFMTSTRDRIKYPVKQWKIVESEKFRLFVTEIRGLVSQLHGMTEQLLPRPVREAMIYTRIWEIKYGWVAHVIALACDDDYAEIAAQARDLSEVLDMDDVEVSDNVRGFIDYWYNNGLSRSYNSKDDADDDDSKNADRLMDIEKNLLALKIRVENNELYLQQPFVPDPTSAVTNGKRLTPVVIGPWTKLGTHTSQDFLVDGVGGPRASPPHIREESVRKPQGNGDAWRFEGNQFHGPPTPAFGPVDNLLSEKTTKPTRTARPRHLEETYTPTTSSAGRTGRDARNRQQWGDLTSDRDLSDIGMESPSGTPLPLAKKDGRPPPPAEPKVNISDAALRQQQAIMRQRFLANLQQASESVRRELVGGHEREREPWPPLQDAGPSSQAPPPQPPQPPPQETAAALMRKQRAAAGRWDEGNDGGIDGGRHHHHNHHHRHCGNCVEEMDEAGRLV